MCRLRLEAQKQACKLQRLWVGLKVFKTPSPRIGLRLLLVRVRVRVWNSFKTIQYKNQGSVDLKIKVASLSKITIPYRQPCQKKPPNCLPRLKTQITQVIYNYAPIKNWQEAHNQAVAIANLTSVMPSSNEISSKRKLTPETSEAEDEENQTAQASNTSSIFAQCSFNS